MYFSVQSIKHLQIQRVPKHPEHPCRLHIRPDIPRSVTRSVRTSVQIKFQNGQKFLAWVGLDWPHPLSITRHIFSSHSRIRPESVLTTLTHWSFQFDDKCNFLQEVMIHSFNILSLLNVCYWDELVHVLIQCSSDAHPTLSFSFVDFSNFGLWLSNT